ncbi:unnamed protein product [Diamesa serratosioi]
MAMHIYIEYSCYIFHDITNGKAFSVNNIYDEIDEHYVDSAIKMEIHMSLMDDHGMDQETMLVHSYSKMLESLMNTNYWDSFSALYMVTIKIQVMSNVVHEEQQPEDLENIDHNDLVNRNVENDVHSNKDSAYESENGSSDATIIEIDESPNTSSSAYHSNNSQHNISGNDADNEIEENEDDEYELENYDIEMVHISEEQGLDADDENDDDEDNEADKLYYENYKYYKTV